MRPLFLTVAALEAEALELRRASLALTLLYLASKSLVEFKRISLTGFSNYTSRFVTRASQSRQHVDTSLIHIEYCKPPTTELFDVDSKRISIVTVNTKEYHSNVLEIITRIMCMTLDNSL
ncbi:hypothetical protein Tco_0498929 [Tanacetum coccineum]